MSKKIVVIGGVAGGATCAARLRRLSEDDEIVILERGRHVSFANCGLPYYVGGIVEDKKELLLQTPETLNARYNLDVRVREEVVSIDCDNKSVRIRKTKDESEYDESYDYLVLSPGAKPVKPPLPGVDSEKVFTLRNIMDAVSIRKFVDDNRIQKAVVVGGGFIGLEMAENLVHRGVEVTLVEKMDQVMPNLDPDIAAMISNHLREKGVDLILGAGIDGFEEKDDKFVAIVENGRRIDTDMAMLSIGVRPDSRIAKEAGIEVNKRDYIIVNEKMETTKDDVFAIGDAVVIKNPITNDDWGIALAGPANRQGRIVADLINGKNIEYKGALGTNVVKVFDLTVGSVGCSEKYLKSNGANYQKSYTHALNHAGYYPGATPITIKLIFNPDDGKILGAQMVGKEGVDKRVDVLASAINYSGSVFDLTELELAYAPPYGSAKDPINVAGYVAENIMRDIVDICHWHDIDDYIDSEDYFLVDVSTPEEFDSATIKSAVNIYINELRDRVDEVPKDKTIVTFCTAGLRGYLAARLLSLHGYKTLNLSGGSTTYLESKHSS